MQNGIPENWTAQLLAFWFDTHGEKDWFGGGPEFDAEVRERFADWRGALRVQPGEEILPSIRTGRAV